MRQKPANGPRPRRAKPEGAQARNRRRLDVGERRAELLAFGIEYFSRRPYDDVSIDDVAKALGISKGLLYHYFPTKRDFYIATLREAASALLEQTRPDPSELPLDRLRSGIGAYLAFVEKRADAYLTLMHSGLGSDREVFRVIDETREKFMARALEQLGFEAPPRLVLVLRGWIGFVEATSLRWLAQRDMPREELAALLVDSFVTLLDVALRKGGAPTPELGGDGRATAHNSRKSGPPKSRDEGNR